MKSSSDKRNKKPKVIRCKKCKNRVLDCGVGFYHPHESLKCTRFEMNVNPNDGCTFGVEGDSDYILKRPVCVELSGHEAVWGWRW